MSATFLAANLLFPSWREILYSSTLALLFVFIVRLLYSSEENRPNSEISDVIPALASPKSELRDDLNEGGNATQEYLDKESTDFFFRIKVELMAASNLPAVNMGGTSDPYAIITCGNQKKFSSVVPGNRNPIWGEFFDILSETLPVTITISIYDWDIIWKSQLLGSASFLVDQIKVPEVLWVPLDGMAGQICVQLHSSVVSKKEASVSNSGSPVAMPMTRNRRFPRSVASIDSLAFSDQQVATEVRQKPGPLQTVFGLPPDEIVLHSYSCALERSFLYHGRMYVSTYHICFHSNVFGKNITLTLPMEDLAEMKKSVHAYINPAIVMILKEGSGGHGVPPLSSPDGRAKYKFASFWNRGTAFKAIHKAIQSFYEAVQASELEEEAAILRSRSTLQESTAGLAEAVSAHFLEAPHLKLEEEAVEEDEEAVEVAESAEVQPFLEDSALSPLLEDELPCSAREYFELLFAEGSRFTETYRGFRDDTELAIEPWHTSKDYGGQNRKISFRALCTSPMCPPTTRMVEWQHCLPDANTVTMEYIQEALDVPFGSYFEVQARWQVTTKGSNLCSVQVTMGVHFKKWCIMQGKIKAGAANEYKADANLILSLARKEIERVRNEVEDNSFLGGEGPFNNQADVGST